MLVRKPFKMFEGDYQSVCLLCVLSIYLGWRLNDQNIFGLSTGSM